MRQVRPRPLDHHEYPVAEPDQEEDMDKGPDDPCQETGKVKLPDVRDRTASPNNGELSLVPVVEGRARTAFQVPFYRARGVLAHLNGDRADTRQRSAFLMIEQRGIAEHEDLGVTRNGAVGFHDGTAD